MTGAIRPAVGALHAELVLPHPWQGDEAAPTTADLVVTVAEVAPHGRPLRVAWIHERADNLGASITNAAAELFDLVQQLVGPCLVVEHYDDRSYEGRAAGRETFALVTVDGGRPHWRHLGDNAHQVVAELVIRAAQDG